MKGPRSEGEMTCTARGFANPHGMKSCGKCGEPLQVHAICAACGLENPPGLTSGQYLVATRP